MGVLGMCPSCIIVMLNIVSVISGSSVVFLLISLKKSSFKVTKKCVTLIDRPSLVNVWVLQLSNGL